MSRGPVFKTLICGRGLTRSSTQSCFCFLFQCAEGIRRLFWWNLRGVKARRTPCNDICVKVLGFSVDVRNESQGSGIPFPSPQSISGCNCPEVGRTLVNTPNTFSCRNQAAWRLRLRPLKAVVRLVVLVSRVSIYDKLKIILNSRK